MAIELHFGPVLEPLADRLGAAIVDRQQTGDPFESPLIITPNSMTQRWLEAHLSERCGVVANVTYRYLEDGLREALGTLDHSAQPPEVLPTELVAEALSAILSADLSRDGLAPIKEYLAGAPASVARRRRQLCDQLARLFLEYEYHREDWVRHWEMGVPIPRFPAEDASREAAQRTLFHDLFGREGLMPQAFPAHRTLRHYATDVLSSLTLDKATGKHAYLFAVGGVSSFHRDLLLRLGQFMDLSLYQLNLCSEFWEDISTPREDRWLRTRGWQLNESDEGAEIAADPGDNVLLKQFGKAGREMIRLLSDLEERALDHVPCEVQLLDDSVPREAGLLATLQQQILTRAAPDGHTSRDDSITVSACQGIHREVECVQQAILLALGQDTSLELTDIAVLVPNIDQYWPVVRQLFDRTEAQLPYCAVETGRSSYCAYADGVRALLTLAEGRLTRPEVVSLLRNNCFLSSMRLTRDEVDQWVVWIEKLAVYHGFREQPSGSVRFTWMQAFRRLRLGHIYETDMAALGEEYDELALRTSQLPLPPYADLASLDEERVGQFGAILEALFARLEGVRSSQTGGQWAAALSALADTFLDDSQSYADARMRRRVRRGLETLREYDVCCGHLGRAQSRLTIEDVTARLEPLLRAGSGSHGRALASGVTIGPIRALHCLPFRHIYVLGLQEGSFPTRDTQTTLDLRAVRRRLGDLSRLEQQQYWFLETLVSARQRLSLSYVCRDLQKDQVHHPGSALQAVLDYLGEMTGERFPLTMMPLKATSGRYFTEEAGPWMTQLDRDVWEVAVAELAAAGQLSAKDQAQAKRSIARRQSQLPEASEEAQPDCDRVTVDDLYWALYNPVQATLRRHLRLYEADLTDADTTTFDQEPFITDKREALNLVLDACHEMIDQVGHGETLTQATALGTQWIADQHAMRQAAGHAPDEEFGNIDRHALLDKLGQRLKGGDRSPGLEDLLQNIAQPDYHARVSLGSEQRAGAFHCGNPEIAEIELAGDLRHVWRDPETGACEHLDVVRGKIFGSDPTVDALRAFLFFLTLKVADSAVPEEERMIGDAPFTVTLAFDGGVRSWRWSISMAASAQFLQKVVLVAGAANYQLLPLRNALDRNMAKPWADMTIAHEAEREQYARILTERITEENDKPWGAKNLKLQSLLPIEVPDDAYLRVRARFQLFMDAQPVRKFR